MQNKNNEHCGCETFNDLDELKIDMRKKTGERRWSDTFLKSQYKLEDYNKVLNCSIADTDFGTPTFISDEIINRANNRSYSYTFLFNESLNSIVKWYKNLHNIELKPEWIKLGHGTVNAMHQAVQSMTQKGDAILIQTPLYKPFEKSIILNERVLVENKLLFNGTNFEIDFVDFESKIKTNKVKMFMFCNPHNPGGVQWSEEDIKKIIKICEENNVFIFSDEVHGDLVLNDNKHLSLLRFDIKNDFYMIASSPSKLFNLAGLQGSYVIIKNKEIYDKVSNQYLKNGLSLLNIFSQQAMIAAYTKPETLEWVKGFKNYIQENYKYVKENLLDNHKDVLQYINMTSSYVIWVKFTSVTPEQFKANLAKENLVISIAEEFSGAELDWFRMNIAEPKKEIMDLVNRLKNALELK